MHAYLIVGQHNELIDEAVTKLIGKLSVKLIEFPLAKIDDVRALRSFTKLRVLYSTAILIKNIEAASTEALNAFLKNLEEPQESLYYILTSPSVKKVLPTIVSRCQVIKTLISKRSSVNSSEIQRFLNMSIGEKLMYVDKIKDRREAIEFIEEFMIICHRLLHTKNQYSLLSQFLKTGRQALTNLKANGNVTLQLANFVINLSS